MANPQPNYLAYLLRLWQVNGDNSLSDSFDQKPIWRASLEYPQTRERIGFASLEELVDFLQAETGEMTAYAKTRPAQEESRLIQE